MCLIFYEGTLFSYHLSSHYHTCTTPLTSLASSASSHRCERYWGLWTNGRTQSGGLMMSLQLNICNLLSLLASRFEEEEEEEIFFDSLSVCVCVCVCVCVVFDIDVPLAACACNWAAIKRKQDFTLKKSKNGKMWEICKSVIYLHLRGSKGEEWWLASRPSFE